MMPDERARYLKQLAAREGFMFCGISRARFLEEEAAHLETWLNRGYAGEMKYLHQHFDKRLDPTLLVPGAKSVVSLGYNYFCTLPETDAKVARYAQGEDYHTVIKDKLYALVEEARTVLGKFEGRVFVDSAPVMERAWARNSGCGWVGKNSLLLTRERGSYFFLAELIIDLELEPDGPLRDYCGTCTACMDACPTQAIPEPYVVDGNRCISYLTIELKEQIPTAFHSLMSDWIFGCDICQEVCPWNRFAATHQEPRFSPLVPAWTVSEWKEITGELFDQLFRLSPLRRAGLAGMKKNAAALSGSSR